MAAGKCDVPAPCRRRASSGRRYRFFSTCCSAGQPRTHSLHIGSHGGTAHATGTGGAEHTQCGRYRLDDDQHGPGAPDDAAGHCTLLWRHGAAHQCAQHHGQRGGRGGSRQPLVVCSRLLHCLHAGQWLAGRRQQVVVPRAGLPQDGGQGGGEPRGTQCAGVGVCHVPALICRHHGGPDCGRCGGAHAVFGPFVVHGPVVGAGVCTDCALGVGTWWLAGAARRAGLCRWLCRAHQRGRFRPGVRTRAGSANRLWTPAIRAL
jgi:hypothetical protein